MLSRLRRLMCLRPIGIEGYSMLRVLLLGLILPAFVSLSLLLSFLVSIRFGLPVAYMCLAVVSSTMLGFAFGTYLLIHLSDRIVRFARVKRKC